MDTESLRTFLSIHEAGGFSNAALRLNRSQSAISRRIALLEDELGMTLFDRVPSGVILSEAGLVLLPHAKRAVAAIKDCEAALADMQSGFCGSLTVAAVGSLASTRLTPLMRRFASNYPGAEFNLRTATSSQVSELVKSGEATIGLRYHLDMDSDLSSAEITAEPLQIICSAEHRYAGKMIESLAELSKERWLLFPNAVQSPESSANNLLAQFQLLGFARIDWASVDSLTAQKRLVESGYGLAVIPASAIEEELALATLNTISVKQLHLENPICVVTRQQGYFSSLAAAFVKLLHEYAETKSIP